MKKHQALSVFLVMLICSLTMGTFAAVRAWTGGGDDDNFSTAANWDGNEAPQAGDTLVFMGDTRTSPVNDYPDGTSFAGIVFSNTASTCSAPFTLSGNRLVLTGATASGEVQPVPGVIRNFGIWPISSTAEIIDTLDLDVDLPNNSALGAREGVNHKLIFKKTVTGGNGNLNSLEQFKSALTFEGPVKNFTKVQRPNGSGGLIWLKSAENEFSSQDSHVISEGTLRVDSLAAYGGSDKGITLGQSSWKTPATLAVNASENTLIKGPILVCGPTVTTVGGAVENCVAGTTVTLSGNLKSRTAVNLGHDTKSGEGSLFSLTGVGDGIFTGNMESLSTWVQKSGSGTWTLAGASCVSTGNLTVAAGTLVVDGDYSSLRKVSVSSGATLGGTGKVSVVTFNSGSKYRMHAGAEGCQALQVTDHLEVNGALTLCLDATLTLDPGREYTLFTFADIVLNGGYFVAGEGIPSSAVFRQSGNSITMTVPTEELVWKGSVANNVWDLTTPNWKDGRVFKTNSGVTFDDSADEGTENVVIAAPVSPTFTRVHGTRNYMFTGAGITGTGGFEKSGSSVLTLANTNSYTGATVIDGGAFVLSGTLDGSSLSVGTEAVFTNRVTGRITGNCEVNLLGAAFELDGTNDFTGGLTLETTFSDSAAKTAHVVLNPAALGAGSVTLKKGSMRFRGVGGAVGRGQTLSVGEKANTMLHVDAQTSFSWLGDVRMHGGTTTWFYLRPNNWATTIAFGDPEGGSVVQASNGARINVRENGVVRWYARLDIGTYEQTDGNVSHFYAPGNAWTSLQAKAGGIVCHATNTLAVAPVWLGQVYQTYVFKPYLDLGGFDQTVSELRMADSIEGSEYTVKSATPAILTISNDVDTVTDRQQGRITGVVTLRKRGTGNWSFGCRNWSGGDVVVEAGTLTVTADDALPTNSVTSCLSILPDAKVALADGVNATVSRLSNGRIEYPAGVYGGTGCATPGATIRPTLFAPGTGSLRVLHGAGGAVIILR